MRIQEWDKISKVPAGEYFALVTNKNSTKSSCFHYEANKALIQKNCRLLRFTGIRRQFCSFHWLKLNTLRCRSHFRNSSCGTDIYGRLTVLCLTGNAAPPLLVACLDWRDKHSRNAINQERYVVVVLFPPPPHHPVPSAAQVSQSVSRCVSCHGNREAKTGMRTRWVSCQGFGSQCAYCD